MRVISREDWDDRQVAELLANILAVRYEKIEQHGRAVRFLYPLTTHLLDDPCSLGKEHVGQCVKIVESWQCPSTITSAELVEEFQSTLMKLESLLALRASAENP